LFLDFFFLIARFSVLIIFDSSSESLAISDAQYKWRSEGNKIQFNSNTENMEDLTQALWAIDNTQIDYARDLVIALRP
jgi:hypothetical protein